jgi:hypothetical protein
MSPPSPPVRMTKLAEYLLKGKVVDEFQLKSALAKQMQWGHRLTRILNDLRLAPENQVVAALAEQAKLSTVDLATIPGDAAAIKKLDGPYCLAKGVFPCALKDQGKTLYLAMCDPTDFATTAEVEQRTRCRLKLLVAGEQALEAAVARCYSPGGARAPTATAHAAATVGIELEAANTGEFMDSGGEIVGKMKAELRALHVETPVADELDSLFDFTPDSLTPEEQKRLEAIKQNQHRGGTILRAVLELCVEKGLLSPDDVNKLRL